MRTLSILLLCVTMACGKKEENEVIPATDMSVIRDLTDTFMLVPQPDPILALFDFRHMPEQAAHLRSVLITDLKLNPTQDIWIESGAKTEESNEHDDIHYREQIIYSFQDAVRKALADFPQRYHGKPLGRSECFATIASELEWLAASKASQRILIVFSDLAENHEDFSCYSESDMRLLERKPARVIRKLQRRHELPHNLVGVTVYFVFQPQTHEQDVQYNKMVCLYQQLLKERGARVVVQATNSQFQL